MSPEEDLLFTFHIDQNGPDDKERPILLAPDLKPPGVWKMGLARQEP
jgi:hypothetical protein